MRTLWRFFKWTALALVLLVVALLSPVAYVELACRGTPSGAGYKPLITDVAFQRSEANSYLTYPEWHIVYAYEGLAEKLKTGDEYSFDYMSSISGFWSSACALTRTAGEHGAADFNTRGTMHVIGVSFTAELVLKALYEETFGHAFAFLRGPVKTSQDIYAADMAADYAAFLQQTPWYKYNFRKSTAELWAKPIDTLRGWERRLALGLEWRGKAAYAGVIANAVQASGEAALTIRSLVSGVPVEKLAAIEGVKIIQTQTQGVLIETPRYRAFTDILFQIAGDGGKIVEIAGNDDVMVTVIAPKGAQFSLPQGVRLIKSVARDGFDSQRILLDVRLSELAPMLQALQGGNILLEHVYDY
jgi:hypothetical protein